MQVVSGESLAVRTADAEGMGAPAGCGPRVWVERLQLSDFRNYRSLQLSLRPNPVVLTGSNGAGKTNLLEAVSLLTSGQGLRRVPYPELARMGATRWTVAARLVTPLGPLNIGTTLAAPPESRRPDQAGRNPGRIVHIDGTKQSGSGILAQHVEMVWLLPAMDGLFTGPAADRRRFLDRLICGLDPSYRSLLGQFERAMQQRNRLLADGARDGSRFAAFERIMAEAGVAIAAARAVAVAELTSAIGARRNAAIGALFPWAGLTLVGTLETELGVRPAVEVEDAYCELLERERPCRVPDAGWTASIRPRRRARSQANAGRGMLHRGAESPADRDRACPLRRCETAPTRHGADPAARRNRRPSRPSAQSRTACRNHRPQHSGLDVRHRSRGLLSPGRRGTIFALGRGPDSPPRSSLIGSAASQDKTLKSHIIFR
jgi:recombinational DNA repair ATPase RecF